MKRLSLLFLFLLAIPAVFAEETTIQAPSFVVKGHQFQVVTEAEALTPSDTIYYQICVDVIENGVIEETQCSPWIYGEQSYLWSCSVAIPYIGNFTLKARLLKKVDEQISLLTSSSTEVSVIDEKVAEQYVEEKIDEAVSQVKEDLQGQIDNLSENYDSLKKDLKENYYTKEEVDEKIEEVSNNIEQVEKDLQKQIDNINENYDALKNRTYDIEYKVDLLGENITNLNKRITDVQKSLQDAIKENVTAIQENITKMKEDIENTYAKKTEVEGVQNYIRGKESEWASWRPLSSIWNFIISRLEELYEKLKSYIMRDFVTRDEYNARIAELENRIAKLEKENAELKAKLAKLEKRLNSLTMTCQLVIDDAYIVETRTFARNAEIPPCEEVLKGMPYKYHYCRWVCK